MIKGQKWCLRWCVLWDSFKLILKAIAGAKSHNREPEHEKVFKKQICWHIKNWPLPPSHELSTISMWKAEEEMKKKTFRLSLFVKRKQTIFIGETLSIAVFWKPLTLFNILNESITRQMWERRFRRIHIKMK
jgi:hypothetical protein